MSKKILVVDDDQNVCLFIKHRLEAHGYQVNVALDGFEAYRQVQEEAPDLLLLDLIMPNMDGTALTEKLKALPATQEIPIIFLTGLIQYNETTANKMIGDYKYISKPFEPQKLLDMIQESVSSV